MPTERRRVIGARPEKACKGMGRARPEPTRDDEGKDEGGRKRTEIGRGEGDGGIAARRVAILHGEIEEEAIVIPD